MGEEDRQNQQFRQQQEQQQMPSQSGVPVRPGAAAASGGGGVDARQIWERRPLVPPDRNPLLGRCSTHAAATIGPKRSPLGDVGSGMVDFRPNTLVSVGPGGNEKVLARVESRLISTTRRQWSDSARSPSEE